MTYETFPFLTFFRIMEDESKLKDYNVSPEDWEVIRNKWILLHEDWDNDTYSKSKQRVLKHQSIYNKLLFLKERSSLSEKGLKELFEKIGRRWVEDSEKRNKQLEKDIAKNKKLHEIYSGEKKGIEQEKEEVSEKASLKTAMECIASLEMSGATIPDYETLTLGKYDALTHILKKKNG